MSSSGLHLWKIKKSKIYIQHLNMSDITEGVLLAVSKNLAKIRFEDCVQEGGQLLTLL